MIELDKRNNRYDTEKIV